MKLSAKQFRRFLLPAVGSRRPSALPDGHISTAEGRPARKNKYGAERTEVDGIVFASKKDAARWQELRLLERAGHIRNLQRQVPIMLMGQRGPLKSRDGRQMRLTVDFTYEDKSLGWATVFEEAKGRATRDYLVRFAVAQAMGIKITEV